MESFWCDNIELIPKVNEFLDCEVWLRTKALVSKKEKKEFSNPSIESFFTTYNRLTNENHTLNKVTPSLFSFLSFPERQVLVIKADKKLLCSLIESCNELAEFRRTKETTLCCLKKGNNDQKQRIEDLKKRLVINNNSKVSVCLLDTGVNNKHLLIKPVLLDEDCHTADPTWSVEDQKGHGTPMSGLIIYGDLQKALDSSEEVKIQHKLESVKLLPDTGNNEENLYGDLTKKGIKKAELKKADRKRIFCMPITTDSLDKGRPSSWSGAIDQISSGAEEENKKRLLIISAGNVAPEEYKNYPDSNLEKSVKDPAQSWNALTIGAYTDKVSITNPDYKQYKPIAKKEELSPFSSTSITWKDKRWPIKPDIVLEGGNIGKDNKNFTSTLEDLSLLSLNYKPNENQLDKTFHATSAATAQASWIASQIQSEYPEIKPETLRALIVHSAVWKEAMKKQFWKKTESDNKNYGRLLRIFGYGVPDLNKAMCTAPT